MRYALMTILAVSFVLSGCDNPNLTYEGDAGTNDNQNNNVSDPNPDPNPDPDFECYVELKSSERIAVWLETDEGWTDFGGDYTVEECPTGPKYTLGFNPTSVFVAAAEYDLDMWSNCYVDMHKINEDPAEPLNFWEYSSTINSFWMLPAYWVFEFFPEDESQAEGFELGASTFICGLDLDMLNLGCDGFINPAFFKPVGRVKQATYHEGEWMPILRFGVIR